MKILVTNLYANSARNKTIRGALYNWSAIDCTAHIPPHDEQSHRVRVSSRLSLSLRHDQLSENGFAKGVRTNRRTRAIIVRQNILIKLQYLITHVKGFTSKGLEMVFFRYKNLNSSLTIMPFHYRAPMISLENNFCIYAMRKDVRK